MKKNETIRLSAEESKALLAIASRTGSLSRHGATAGKPSWRVLLKDLASGRVKVKGGRQA